MVQLKTNSAGGHTQTWEYAGPESKNNKNGAWFIGTKGQKPDNSKYYWDIQLARVKFPTTASKNTELTRISHLNQVGLKQKVNFDGTMLLRTEAAVTPNYDKLLIVAIDSNYYAHFGLYSLATVNQKLNEKESTHGHVRLDSIKCDKAFKVDITAGGEIPSLQGFDIDNQYNIYVSCQHSPSSSGSATPRQIVKIPWGETNSNNWYSANFDTWNEDIDISGYYTEFENIQVIDDDSLYLTVAYHDSSTSALTVKKIRYLN